jgi:hypothetical protein
MSTTRRARKPAGQTETKRPYRKCETVRVRPPACSQCGSTEGRVNRTTRQEYGGTLSDGRVFTHIVRRWKVCECGNHYVIVSHENHVEAAPDNFEKISESDGE